MKPSEHRGLSFWVGIFLMAVSFLVYPTYPTIALLPISTRAKVAGGLASWSISWLVFALGSVLAGRAGREWIWTLLTRRQRREDLLDERPDEIRRRVGP